MEVTKSNFLLVAIFFCLGHSLPLLKQDPQFYSCWLPGMWLSPSSLMRELFCISSSYFQFPQRNLFIMVTSASLFFCGHQMFGGIGVECKRHRWSVRILHSSLLIIIFSKQWRVHPVCVGKDLEVRSAFFLGSS